MSSVRLRFPGPSGPPSLPNNPALRVAFLRAPQSGIDQRAVHVRWINTLDSCHGLSLDGVYQTNSMLLILQARYSVYLQMAALPGIHLISETTSQNILKQLIPPVPRGFGDASSLQENIRPTPRGFGDTFSPQENRPKTK
jgi:hypothetical protein